MRLELSPDLIGLLRCPKCYSDLSISNNELICNNSTCNKHYPYVNKIPILINEEESIFLISDFIHHNNTTFNYTENKLKKAAKLLTPKIGKNFRANDNFNNFFELIFKNQKKPKILVIGGSIIGEGLSKHYQNCMIDFISTDVSFGPTTNLISDAHNIPFGQNTFDGVIIQAVLEHVLDPYRCMDEIHRVLKTTGYIYVETPFMQQVHMGKYDFQRFTHLGHRRLLRQFEEIESGPTAGPGTALAWSYKYFLRSFVKNKLLKEIVISFAHFSAFWLKYFDFFLLNKPGVFDSASGYYFIGKYSNTIISDKEILNQYKGLG